jgi:hypothetical protein
MTHTQTHRGINFSASTKQRLVEMISDSDFESSIFSRNSGHGRSSYARLLQNGNVEYVSFYNKVKTVKVFKSKADYYNQ